MGQFQKGGDRGGNRGGFGGGRSNGKPSFQKKEWGGRDNRETTMHKATCSDCSKSCEVPFRPTGEKPVLCSDCFGGKKEGGRDNGFGAKKSFDNRFENREPFGAKKSFGDREMRPIREFKAPNPNAGAFSDEVKKTLSEMNSKIDRLVTTLEKLAAVGQIAATTSKKEAAPVIKTPAPKPLPAPVRKVVATPATKKVVAKAVSKVVVKKVVVAKPAAKVVAKTVTKVVVKKVVAKKVIKK